MGFDKIDNLKEEDIKALYEAKLILEGLEDVKKGDVVDGDSAILKIKKKYNLI